MQSRLDTRVALAAALPILGGAAALPRPLPTRRRSIRPLKP